MLQQVCEYVHNMFIKDVHVGNFEIVNGMISLPFMKEGQRFWLINSDLNDGVYTYHSDGIKNDDDTEVAGLRDETFAGTICSMAVPPPVIELSGEIQAWVDKYGETVNSPYQSESVLGVYSYTKASGGNADGGADASTWQGVFKDRLNRWRKVSF